MAGEITKRDMIGMAGGMGAAMLLLARQAQAQTVNASVDITPQQAGALHNQFVAARRAATPDRQPLGRDSLVALMDELVANGVITPQQRDFLVDLIDLAFSAESRSQLQDLVEAAIKAAQSLLDGVVGYIAEIYSSSIRLAADLLADVDWPTARRAIISDLYGAAAGAGFSGIFGPQVAIIFALVGGASVSSLTYAGTGAA